MCILQALDAVGCGFEVVDEIDARDTDGLRQHVAINFPSEVRRLDAPAHDGAGDAEASVLNFGWVRRDVFLDDRVERIVLLGRKTLLRDGRAEFVGVLFEERDVGFRPANVSGQNHDLWKVGRFKFD